MEVEETFTNIILVTREDTDEESPPADERGEREGEESEEEEEGEESEERGTSAEHLTWTVLTRLASLCRANPTCVCEEVTVHEGGGADLCYCAFHYYLQVCSVDHSVPCDTVRVCICCE